ncbi:hypothetical protein ACNVED_15305 (plasmid) [Legionella sp. D16C41]|uniref:hypothetical protein n=1 Tax=Legionella sp. D16C41 TaxID=3402688 RepID=UPI003AF8ADB5
MTLRNYFSFFKKKEKDNNNYFNQLPPEIIMLINCKLDNKSLAKFSLTSKENYYLTQNTITYIDVVVNHRTHQILRVKHYFSTINQYLKKQANLNDLIKSYEKLSIEETINLTTWVAGGITAIAIFGYLYGSFGGWLGSLIGNCLDSSLNYMINTVSINTEPVTLNYQIGSLIGQGLGVALGGSSGGLGMFFYHQITTPKDKYSYVKLLHENEDNLAKSLEESSIRP